MLWPWRWRSTREDPGAQREVGTLGDGGAAAHPEFAVSLGTRSPAAVPGRPGVGDGIRPADHGGAAGVCAGEVVALLPARADAAAPETRSLLPPASRSPRHGGDRCAILSEPGRTTHGHRGRGAGAGPSVGVARGGEHPVCHGGRAVRGSAHPWMAAGGGGGAGAVVGGVAGDAGVRLDHPILPGLTAQVAVLPAPRVPAFAPLRHRDFRLLWIGLVISNTGSWMQFVALGYLVDRLTQSPLYLGILAFAQAVPRLLVALVGGTAADRIDRRRGLLATNLFLLISAGVLGLLTAPGLIQTWQGLVLGALNLLVQSVDVPARHSLVPQLVEEREVLTAVTLNSVAFNGSGIFGPSLGGVIIAAAGEAGCFYLNAASFLSVVAALWVMTVPPQQGPSRAPLSDDLRGSVPLVPPDRRVGAGVW